MSIGIVSSVHSRPVQPIQNVQRNHAAIKTESPAEEKRETPAVERMEHQRASGPNLGHNFDTYI